ncbi:hypothetical protein GPJ56_004172 [Histomonas meleagridis]|uniref:uncharacterized protein n=1 Tax=Histomonas meleagridis TaxID=135588 RepID=UPI00355A56E2|nr:hypothetical protein GPJ56_004172 [Histomonas meleagridis]KAH0801514.1 hypothetical protein GO595_005650 [Histomonas meleagridis]
MYNILFSTADSDINPKISFLTSAGKPFVFNISMPRHPSPYIIAQTFEGQNYIVLYNYLFRIERQTDVLIIQCVDENSKIFDPNITPIPSKGILFQKDEVGTDFPRKKLGLNLYNPITHQLFDVEKEIPIFENFYLRCLSTISAERLLIVVSSESNKENYHMFISKISDLKFTLTDYTYETPTYANECTQYIPDSEEGFTKISKDGYINYLPVTPFNRYRIIKGTGDVPFELRAPNYEEVDEYYILSRVGAPIFCYYQSFGDNELLAGSVNYPTNLTIVSTQVQFTTSNAFACIGFSRKCIFWMGIVSLVYNNVNTDNKPRPTRWKVPIPEKTIDLMDDEILLAIDPGEIFVNFEETTKVNHCLGGKWIPLIKKQSYSVSHLIIVHEKYVNLIDDIPNQIYSDDGGKEKDEINGFVKCGVVGCDVGMVMFVTHSHFYNENDIEITDKNDSADTIGEFVVSDGTYKAKGNKLYQEFSELYMKLMDMKKSMMLVPGGVVTYSGDGDGVYGVYAKNVDGKAVCAFIAFV